MMTMVFCTVRRGSLEGWREDALGVLVTQSWLMPFLLLIVFGENLKTMISQINPKNSAAIDFHDVTK
jgi:hypothetical protein